MLVNKFVEITGGFTGPSVLEKDGIIIIEGINARYLSAIMDRYYGTSRISKYMFKQITWNKLIFYSFYALEFLYVINQILTTPRTPEVSFINSANEDGLQYMMRRSVYVIKNKLKTNTWLRGLDLEYPDLVNHHLINEFHFKPTDYQQNFFNQYSTITQRLNLKGLILDSAPGSGKTFMSLALTRMLECDHVIILSPANAIYNIWAKAIDIRYDKCLFKTKKTLWRSDEDSFDKLDFTRDYTVIHYEALEKLAAIINKKKPFGKFAIIVDESHNFNEEKSNRTNLLVDIVKKLKPDHYLPISGTPVKAMHREVIPLFMCIDPLFTNKVAENFSKIYSSQSSYAHEILQHRFSQMRFRVTKDQIGIPTPKINNIAIPIKNGELFTLTNISKEMRRFIDERKAYYTKLEPETNRKYNEYVNKYVLTYGRDKYFIEYERNIDFIRNSKTGFSLDAEKAALCNKFEKECIMPLLSSEEKKDFSEIKSLYKYPELKIRGECLGRVVLGARIAASGAIADALSIQALIEVTEKKTIIFTNFVDTLKILSNKCKEKNIHAAFVYAETNKFRDDIIDAFKTEEGLNPLGATYNSLSASVELTEADHIVMMDTPYRDLVLQQAISRCNRKGATTQTIVDIFMIDTNGEPNITDRNIDILKWSQDQVKSITGTDAPFELEDTKDNSLSDVYTEECFFIKKEPIFNLF